jgi:5-methylcytosine-specific restriction protein A
MPRDVPMFRSPGYQPRQEQNRDYDRRRRTQNPWRSWYNKPVWKRRRADQLARQPLCERCMRNGMTIEADVVHHVMPHHGDWHLFVSGELESLCKRCHDREAQAEERAGTFQRVQPAGGGRS